MKEIKVGENNDLHLYAIDAGGMYVPLDDNDLRHERPDAKIYYDSGLYPGITFEELPQYICGKATRKRAAATIGSIGGQSATVAKAAAARANGRKGGRPRKNE